MQTNIWSVSQTLFYHTTPTAAIAVKGWFRNKQRTHLNLQCVWFEFESRLVDFELPITTTSPN